MVKKRLTHTLTEDRRGWAIFGDEREIIGDIRSYIESHGGEYNNRYVGTSEDARDIPPNWRNVEGYLWAYKKAYLLKVAEPVRDYLVNILGTSGDAKGKNGRASIVYALKKTMPFTARETFNRPLKTGNYCGDKTGR